MSWARRYRSRYAIPAVAVPGPPAAPTGSGPAIPFTVP